MYQRAVKDMKDAGRSPHGERGLKLLCDPEMWAQLPVAPPAGSVD